MSKIFIDFRPAEFHHGKEPYVSYYVINPETQVLARKKVKLNHIHSAREREKYARLLCKEINDKLYNGWNPYLEKEQNKRGQTLRQAIDDFFKMKKKSLRPSSIKTYESYINFLYEWIAKRNKNLFVTSFSMDDADTLIVNFTNCGERGYNNAVRFFRLLFNYFIKCSYITKNPFAHIQVKRAKIKERTIIPPEIRRRIFDYFMARQCEPFIYVMQLCYRCFIRPKEILMLKIENIDYTENLLYLPGDITKNHNARVIGVPDEIMAYFLKIKNSDKRLYIFSSHFLPGKEQLASNEISKIWSKMRSDLGLPLCYQFYSLKDTGITEMLEAGVPAKFVKELADHHSLEMTEKYIHKSSAKKILEWNKLEF